MKQRLSKALKVILALALCAGMLFTMLPAQQAEAAKMTNKKAQKILKKKIKNKFCKYAFVDIDGDKIDEMIVLGYSGKFTGGDDSKKSVTVYKVSGKKAKSVFSHSVKGDYFKPSLAVNLYDDDGDLYIGVIYIHEGYGYSATYKYNGKNFVEIARVDSYYAEGEDAYHFGKNDCTQEEYNEYIADILAAKLDVEFTNPSTKITNNYIKKLLNANYEHRKSIGFYDGYDVNTYYEDYDEDGVDELYVQMSDEAGEMLYYYPGLDYYDYNTYYVDTVEYKITKNGIDYDDSDYERYTIRWCEANGDIEGKYSLTNMIYIEVDDDGDEVEFEVTVNYNSYEYDIWEYTAEYAGKDDEGRKIYICKENGKRTIYVEDKDSGEEECRVDYKNGSAEFIYDHGSFYWHDLNDETKTYWDEEFIRTEI
ncbi:MAG: hypothetical protein K6E85_16870 [Lachnospiraceae bacterium]|nr:hypothetical protein [Lachnospiraceae bacterium]